MRFAVGVSLNILGGVSTQKSELMASTHIHATKHAAQYAYISTFSPVGSYYALRDDVFIDTRQEIISEDMNIEGNRISTSENDSLKKDYFCNYFQNHHN